MVGGPYGGGFVDSARWLGTAFGFWYDIISSSKCVEVPTHSGLFVLFVVCLSACLSVCLLVRMHLCTASFLPTYLDLEFLPMFPLVRLHLHLHLHLLGHAWLASRLVCVFHDFCHRHTHTYTHARTRSDLIQLIMNGLARGVCILKFYSYVATYLLRYISRRKTKRST